MAPALTRGTTGVAVEGDRPHWLTNAIMGVTAVIYVLIAAPLVMLMVAAAYEGSWRDGVLVSIFVVVWGVIGGCGTYSLLCKEAEQRSRRGSDDVESGDTRGGGGRDSGCRGEGATERDPLLSASPPPLASSAAMAAAAARAGAFTGW